MLSLRKKLKFYQEKEMEENKEGAPTFPGIIDL